MKKKKASKSPPGGRKGPAGKGKLYTRTMGDTRYNRRKTRKEADTRRQDWQKNK